MGKFTEKQKKGNGCYWKKLKKGKLRKVFTKEKLHLIKK